MSKQQIQLMHDLESRYRTASGLVDRSQYKIFYGPLHRAEILVLGINPGGRPANMLPDGMHHKDGIGLSAASASYYENGKNDLLDCSWPENNVLKLLIPMLGGEREAVREHVIKSNMAFQRSAEKKDIDIEAAMNRSQAFLSEIISVVQPSLVLLTGVSIDDFTSSYAARSQVVAAQERDPGVKQVIFEASRVTLTSTGDNALVVRVAHASQFSWTYDRYGVVDRIGSLRAIHG